MTNSESNSPEVPVTTPKHVVISIWTAAPLLVVALIICAMTELLDVPLVIVSSIVVSASAVIATFARDYLAAISNR